MSELLELTIKLAQLLQGPPPAVCPQTGVILLEGSGWRLELQPTALPKAQAVGVLAHLYGYLHIHLNPAIRAHCAAQAFAPDDSDQVYTLIIGGYPVLASTSCPALRAVFHNLTGRTQASNSTAYAEYIAWLAVQCGREVAGRYARIDTAGWVVAGPELIPVPGAERQ